VVPSTSAIQVRSAVHQRCRESWSRLLEPTSIELGRRRSGVL
jgi:hypothetical protein